MLCHLTWCHWRRQGGQGTLAPPNGRAKKNFFVKIEGLLSFTTSVLKSSDISTRLLATLPITTAEAERVFSKMEKTATAIRAAMEKTRLQALLLLRVPRDLTPSFQGIIDKFAATRARRLKLKLKSASLTLCLRLKDDISVTDILKISKIT